MNNNVTIYNYPAFGDVRTIAEDDEILFNAKDVCDALGYSNARKAVNDHVYSEDVTKRYTPTESGKQEMNYVTEEGLYALIFGSKLENAKPFKKWVAGVIKQIRQTGYYSLKEERNQFEEENTQLKKQLSTALNFPTDVMTMRTAANYITICGKPIGQNKLFAMLRGKYLQKCDTHYNEPYQRYISSGHFCVTTTRKNHIVTLVTPKGFKLIQSYVFHQTHNYKSFPLF